MIYANSDKEEYMLNYYFLLLLFNTSVTCLEFLIGSINYNTII